MYLCLDKEAEHRKRNHFLEDIADGVDLDGKWRSRLPTKILGDAFVFKMANEASSEGTAQEMYVDMDEDFMTDAMKDTEPKGFAYKTLENILLEPTNRG